MLSFEFAILDWIQTNLRNPVMDLLMPVITSLGNSGLIWILLGVILLFMPKHRKAGIAVLAGLAGYLLQLSAEAAGRPGPAL